MGCKCIHSSEIEFENMKEKGAEGLNVRWLITKNDGAPNFAMRLFEIQAGGYSPYHSHDWEHEVYILEGDCNVTCEKQKIKVGNGYVVFIPPRAKHQFVNVGKSTLKFLCMVPHHK